MNVKIQVTADGDRLTITGVDDDDNVYEGYGWLSATTNFFPASAYNADGTRKAGVKARAMTDDEKRSYFLAQLGFTQSGGQVVEEPEPAVVFEDPGFELPTIAEPEAISALP